MGLLGVLVIVRGTLTGTSLADIMYGVLMRRVLGRCRVALVAEGLVESMDTPGVDALFGLAGGTCGPTGNANALSHVDDVVRVDRSAARSATPGAFTHFTLPCKWILVVLVVVCTITANNRTSALT